MSERGQKHKGEDPNANTKTNGCSSMTYLNEKKIKKPKGLLDCETVRVQNSRSMPGSTK